MANHAFISYSRKDADYALLLSGEVLFRLGRLRYVDVTDESMPGPRFTAHLRRLVRLS